MLPTLRDGDWIVSRRDGRARPGDVVVLERPDRPGLLIVKRVARVGPEGFWALGDHQAESTDSRVFGWARVVEGRVLWRVRPWGRVR